MADGKYMLRLLLKKLGEPASGDVPADHISSEPIIIVVDNTVPTAEVSLDLGPCTKHKLGDTIHGKFTATDTHFKVFTLEVLPDTTKKPLITPTIGSYSTFPGGIDEPFSLKTTSKTTPCGYVVRLYVEDRTIRNNHYDGNHKPNSVGLCLLDEPGKKK